MYKILRSLKNLNECLDLDSTVMSSFDEYVSAYLTLRYRNKYPVYQPVENVNETTGDVTLTANPLLNSAFDDLYIIYTNWVSARNNALGLDVDISALLDDVTTSYETPGVSSSSSQWSSRDEFTRPHTGSYINYLSARLNVNPSFLGDKFDEWTDGLWVDAGRVGLWRYGE